MELVHLLILWIWSCCSFSTQAKVGSIRSKAKRNDASIRCRLTSINSDSEYGCSEIVNGKETSGFFHVVPPSDLIQQHIDEVTIGRLIVDIAGATVEKGDILLSNDSNFTVAEDSQASRHLQWLSTKSLGTRTLFIVRVSAPDSSHPKSLSDLQQFAFRTDTTGFKTQYEACSWDKLKWESAGGADIMLSNPIASYKKASNLVDEAQKKLEAQYGKAANQIADHVFFCNPPNSIEFTAVAGVDSWRVNSHASLCTSLSTWIHEVGHNLGLLNSGEGSESYGDYTGYMGAGSYSETGPVKCFNGYKHYQLQWYGDRQLNIVDPSTPTKMNLTTFVDYNQTVATNKVLVSVGNQLYLQYNRAKGMNVGTNEKPDAVTVTDRGGSNSLMYAGLTAGQQYTQSNFLGTGRTLVIAACRRLDQVKKTVKKKVNNKVKRVVMKRDMMEIAIGYDKSWC